MDRLRDGWWALIGRLVCEWVGAFLVWAVWNLSRLHLAGWSEGFGPVGMPIGIHSQFVFRMGRIRLSDLRPVACTFAIGMPTIGTLGRHKK